MVALVAAGSMAYFTDSTAPLTNTMTIGKVGISVAEENMNGHEFDQAAYDILPGTSLSVWNEDGKKVETAVNGLDYPVVENLIDKSVITTVADDSADCYVRTIVLFESTTDMNGNSTVDHLQTWKNVASQSYEDYPWTDFVNVNGQNYFVIVYTSTDVLSAGDEYMSMKCFNFNSSTTEEHFEGLDDQYDVHVLSQAVQYIPGESADARTALNTAFPMTKENIQTWFAGVENK